MSDKPIIRTADMKDVKEIYPELTSFPYTFRAWAIEWQGSVAALAGFILRPDDTIAFSVMRQGVNAPKRMIIRTAKEMLEVMRSTGLPLKAVRDKCHNNSGKFLTYLGFEKSSDLGGVEVYKWQTH